MDLQVLGKFQYFEEFLHVFHKIKVNLFYQRTPKYQIWSKKIGALFLYDGSFEFQMTKNNLRSGFERHQRSILLSFFSQLQFMFSWALIFLIISSESSSSSSSSSMANLGSIKPEFSLEAVFNHGAVGLGNDAVSGWTRTGRRWRWRRQTVWPQPTSSHHFLHLKLSYELWFSLWWRRRRELQSNCSRLNFKPLKCFRRKRSLG